MAKKSISQPELLEETPAAITNGLAGDPNAETALVDDAPDKVKMDLRKFNRAKQKVGVAITNLQSITIINSKEGVDKMMLLLKEADGVGKVIEEKRKALGDPYRLEVVRVNACAAEIVKDLPGAIKVGKDLILAFHKEEERKAKVRRTEARQQHLVAAGMWGCAIAEGLTGRFDYYTNDSGQRISYAQIEDYTDEMWNRRLQDQVEERSRIAATKVRDLENELAGADFFGDETAAVEIKEKIAEVKTAPAPAVSHGYGSYIAPKTQGVTKRWVFEVTSEAEVPRAYLQVNEAEIRKAIVGGARSIPGVRIYEDESISLR